MVKSVSYHTMLTSPPTFGTSHGVLDLNSFLLIRTRRKGWKHNCLHSWSNVNLLLHGRTSYSQHHGRTPTFHLFNTMVSTHLLHTMVGTQLLHTMVGTQLNLFQNLPNSQPISTGHDVIHTPASFSVRGLLWQWWLSYPSVTCTQCYAPELLTRIVQSPTKLNDEIWLMKNDFKKFLNYITEL